MRLSRKIVQVGIATAFSAFAVLPSQIGFAAPAENGWQVTVETAPPRSTPSGTPTQPFRMRLGFSDERAALQALQFALNEVGDGSTFVWHRKAGALSGTVRPTAAFVDDEQRLCRHVVFSLSAGERTSTIEGIACRTQTGLWQL